MDDKQIKNLAHLARLEISDDQIPAVRKDITEILTWIDQINGLNTDGVEPLLSAAVHTLPQRADVCDATSRRTEILANAPETDAEKIFFAVPKVVE